MIHGDDLAGLAAACAAAACFDGAIAFQALEARDIPTEGGMRLSMLARLIRRPRWALATGMAILGWPFQLLALSLAPLPLVQPTLWVGRGGAARSASALMSKLITDELAGGRIAAALGWGVATGVAALAGLLGEMSALQRRTVSRVAPPIFVISTVVPVLFAPFLTGEKWGHTPLGGVVIVVSLAAVALGGAMLGQSKA